MLKEIAAAQAEAALFEVALITARSIERAWHRAKALREVAAAQGKARQLDAARATFASALATAGELGAVERAFVLLGISQTLAEAGDLDAARTTAASALAAAQDIGGAHYRAWALREIAQALAAINSGAGHGNVEVDAGHRASPG